MKPIGKRFIPQSAQQIQTNKQKQNKTKKQL